VAAVEKDSIAIICLSVVGLVTVIGFFWTKTVGWGKYSTSTLVLILALFIAAILLLLGKLESSSFANVLFAIVGYGGGLIAGKKGESE
jgi:uncharacterized protein YebE (UPF0316 family)